MGISKNPEVILWSEIQRKRAAERIESNSHTIYFIGGSSCAFSIDPPIVSDITGIEVQNLGVTAGSGVRFLIGRAFEEAKSGDVIVLALETHFLDRNGSDRITSLGIGLAFDGNNPDVAVGNPVFEGSVSINQLSQAARPGALYSATMIGKLLSGKELYRYSPEDLLPGGRMRTDFQDVYHRPAGDASIGRLSTEGRVLLEQVRKVANERNIDVYYSLPWLWTRPEAIEVSRHKKALLLKDIQEIIPVLVDPYLGTRVEKELFADTSYHLSDEGANERSRIVANSLNKVLFKK